MSSAILPLLSSMFHFVSGVVFGLVVCSTSIHLVQAYLIADPDRISDARVNAVFSLFVIIISGSIFFSGDKVPNALFGFLADATGVEATTNVSLDTTQEVLTEAQVYDSEPKEAPKEISNPEVIIKEVVKEIPIEKKVVVEKEINRSTDWTTILVLLVLLGSGLIGLTLWLRSSSERLKMEHMFKSKVKQPKTARIEGTFVHSADVNFRSKIPQSKKMSRNHRNIHDEDGDLEGVIWSND